MVLNLFHSRGGRSYKIVSVRGNPVLILMFAEQLLITLKLLKDIALIYLNCKVIKE
jgi:hypothetical protein